MASRKSRTKARAKLRFEKRIKNRADNTGGRQLAAKEHADLVNLKPSPFDGERIEDLAVFTKASREQLSSELQVQASAVGGSLDLVQQGDFDQAMECLKSISRSSPFSEWRLFVRGLIAFYSGDSDDARQNWLRLDRSRRPARIASTLILAETNAPLDSETNLPPPKLVAAAKELRFRPAAVSAAQRIAAVKQRNPENTFSASQVAMLTEFRDEYRQLDPEFVSRFSQACVRLAYFQSNSDIFEILKKSVPGPALDPKWNLQGLLYYSQFAGAEDPVEQCSKAYIDVDLPRLEHFAEDLKRALASSLCLRRAEFELLNTAGMGFPFSFMEEPIDSKRIEKMLREAIKKYPANRKAHTKLIEVLQMQLDDRGINKRTEEAIEKGMVSAKASFVKAFPDEVETILWLIDHYFDEDQLEQADTLVKRLGEQRLDDPRAKALPWKLKLREAMRLCKRKTSLEDARLALDAAESIWPKWLRSDWLPFLRAAIELRAGEKVKFEQLSTAAREGCGACSNVGDVMTFAALQQMNLPSVELKPFRDIAERHALNAKDMLLTELCELGAFFWDLSRTGLQYKAYRLQASKFGKVLCKRLNAAEPFEVDPVFLDASSWIASHGFWKSDYSYKPPAWISPISAKEPKAAAAVLQWLLDQPYSRRRILELGPEIALLKEAARNASDPFYRHRFDKIAGEASASVAEFESMRRNRSRFDPFGGSPFADVESEEIDSGDGSEEDNECDCARCRARRAREKSSGPRAKRQPKSSTAFTTQSVFEFDDADDQDDVDYEDWQADEDDDDDDDEDDEGFDSESSEEELPKILLKVVSKLGPSGMDRLQRVIEKALNGTTNFSDPLGPLNAIKNFFLSNGLSAADAAEFVLACEQGGQNMGSMDASAPSRPVPGSGGATAQERRDLRKQRRKQLQKKNQKRR